VKPLATFEKWYGRDQSPPEIIKLRAGQLDLEFQEGDLRYIRYGGQELIRRIYAAIRDVNWNTIPAQVNNLSIDSAEDHFQIQFDARHEAGSLAFHWHAFMEGTSDGTIEYSMDGEAETDFRYCRIGFCVLHPVAGIAGSPYHAMTPGGHVSGVLPELIEPQLMENGFETAMFPSCSSLTIETPAGLSVVTEFEGDLFETEDQRNWTDGSFKTYCTPISLGYPHEARAGQSFYQRVKVQARWSGQAEVREESGDSKVISLTLGKATGQPLPRIGIGMASHGQDLEAREIELLSRLRPDHLKVEAHLGDAPWMADLERAIAAAGRMGTALELAVFLADDPEEALEALKSRITGVPVARVIVLHEVEASLGTTSARWMELVRKHLAVDLPGTEFVGGTNGSFAELNRQRPDISAMDGVSYTISPQVHAWDERSLIEAIEGQRDTVRTARSYCGTLPICVSSVTLKPPFNQAATEEEAPQDPDELPAAVDQRQLSLFAAAWTVGSIRALASGGADSITYYETTGWRGLMETAYGSPLPDKFRSFPGMLYPVYWVFAFLADAREATFLESSSGRPLLLEGLAFEQDARVGLLLANLQPCSQEVCLSSLPGGNALLQRLNEDTMLLAASDPNAFLRLSESLEIHAGEAAHVLKAYETAYLEMRLE
jgi:hypothetical protein